MDNKKRDGGPLTAPCGEGRGPRASSRLGLAGLVWLLCALFFSLWWGEGGNAPHVAEQGGPVVSGLRPDAAGRQAASAEEREARPAWAALHALVSQTLPRALPFAHWQCEDEASGAGGARRYRITGPCAPLRLAVALLEKLRPAASLDSAPLPGVGGNTARPRLSWTDEGVLEMRLNGRLSHSFHFPGRERELADLARPMPAAALILVMDDLGRRLEDAEALAALPFPVALAVWPLAPKSGATAALAGQMALDCLVHLPMEPLPRADGSRPAPGPGALLTNMSTRALAAVLEPALAAAPTALGLNNHMGSAFTGSAAASRRLCAQLAGRGLAVLDSLTQPHSRLAEEARAAGLVSLSRTVFLDTRRKTSAILAALDAAAARARSGGFAVAIGHPYPETFSALRRWQDKTGVAVIPLRRLLWHLAQRQGDAG
ncbi:divergent polysaccharide deacetylase family protein [Desulfovibrio sp. SGI.169]|uniref:divergent polysaccharide deacetylase family protein n=1 Tax=Desulfovibrio sp. SGI.169 TaxID=3420561 RepID=UPI003D05AFA4